MPEKSASIAQQRLMGMAYAARTNRLDTSKIKDKSWREKVEKIANSDKFSDKTLHKMASTKYKDEKTGKLRPYLIGKGTPENPEKKRRPYKKKSAVSESYIMNYSDFAMEKDAVLFYEGYCEALSIMGEDSPTIEELFETIMANAGVRSLGLNHNNPGAASTQTGTQPVKRWKNVDTGKNAPRPDTEDDDELHDIQYLKTRRSAMGDPYIKETFEEFIKENIMLNPGMNVQGMGSVTMPGSPGTNTDFHNQTPGSGDMPARGKVKDDEEEEEEAKRIKKALSSKKK